MEFWKGGLESLGMNEGFWKNKNVLLTGHTGFKGSWLSLWLQKLGSNVTGFSDSIPTEPSLFKSAEVEKGMKSMMGDIRNYEELKKIVDETKPEIIIHMAAQSLVKKSYRDPIETYSTNIMGVVNILEITRKIDHVKICMIVTSDKCYENRNLERGYNENDPMGGYDPYSSSKGCAELITNSFRNSFFNLEESKTEIASVRAGNVIGGGDWSEDRLIPDIMKGILNNERIKIRNPDSIRPWQFVLEPLRGYLSLIENLWNNPKEFSEGWNFGPDDTDAKPVSWIVKQIENSWNEKINWQIEKNDKLHEAEVLKLDCTKAKERLGWKPKMELTQGLQFVIEWYSEFKKGENMRKITEEQIDEYERIFVQDTT